MKRFAAIGFVLVVTQGAFAHQPTMSDGTAIGPDSAIELDDIQLSRVIYHEITEDAPSLWLTFQVDEPQSSKICSGRWVAAGSAVAGWSRIDGRG